MADKEGFPLAAFYCVMISSEKERSLLANTYKIVNYASLKRNKDRLKNMRLDGVSQNTSSKLAKLVQYLESSREEETDMDSVLERFDENGHVMESFIEFFIDPAPLHYSSQNSDEDIESLYDAYYFEAPEYDSSGSPASSDDIHEEEDLEDQLEMIDRKEEVADEGEKAYVDFDGNRFHRGDCCGFSIPGKPPLIVGIRSFTPNGSQANCVSIVRLVDTSLGQLCKYHQKRLIEATGRACPSGYVQVRNKGQRLQPLPLSALKKIDEDNFPENDGAFPLPTKLPNLIYEWNSKHSFAFYFDRNETNRVGPRGQKNVMELFCGAGMMHQGYKDSGFTTIAAIDNDEDAIETFKWNNRESENAAQCVDVKEYLRKYKKKEVVHLVHASAPCQGHSMVNQGGKNDYSNNELSNEWHRSFRMTNALGGIFENVTGMWIKSKGYLRTILLELLEMGYQFRTMILRACDYGDPQTRPRLFIFATKYFVPLPRCPPVTHVDPKLKQAGKYPDEDAWITVGDCLEGLSMVPTKPDGSYPYPNMDDIRETKTTPGERKSMQLEMNQPAGTIRGNGAVFHYSRLLNRCTSVRENAALMSLPHDYKIAGKSLTKKYKQVGNGVPCNLARATAQEFHRVLRFVYREELEYEHGWDRKRARNREKKPDVIDLTAESEVAKKPEVIDMTAESEVVDLTKEQKAAEVRAFAEKKPRKLEVGLWDKHQAGTDMKPEAQATEREGLGSCGSHEDQEALIEAFEKNTTLRTEAAENSDSRHAETAMKLDAHISDGDGPDKDQQMSTPQFIGRGRDGLAFMEERPREDMEIETNVP